MMITVNKEVNTKMSKKLGIYSPWVIFAKKIQALFEKDSDVTVQFDDGSYTVSIFVDDDDKAEALSKIMPTTKVFGNIAVNINIVPANSEETWNAKYYEAAFKGNAAFSHMTIVKDIPGAMISNPIAYCVFKKEVVQYGADDLSSESGVASTLYQDIAKDVFGETDGVYFCTDVK